MSVWILPDHIADVLPAQARHIEALRRSLLNSAATYGYELVIPPAFEYLNALLTGTGSALNLQTFKLVDQLSGRSMGLRADTTPQVARIDAHLLAREGLSRLTYCGSVFHTKPARPHASREPLQLGCELYGHAGLEAEMEILQLALDSLQALGLEQLTLDLADVGMVDALMASCGLDSDSSTALHTALAAKDRNGMQAALSQMDAAQRQLFTELAAAYGPAATVLAQLRRAFAQQPQLLARLDALQLLVEHLQAYAPNTTLLLDMADNQGWNYYNGIRFAMYAQAPGQTVGQEILRGGRYDGVGSVFGHKQSRHRPAVGFSLDLKELASVCPLAAKSPAIYTTWHTDPAWQQAVQALRQQGHTVICQLSPNDPGDSSVYACSQQLVLHEGAWVLQ